jgi:hypothetical protein
MVDAISLPVRIETFLVLSLIDVTYKLICKVPFDFNQ